MARTHDKAFDVCPICGRMPKITTYQMYCGTALCNGTIFNRHHLIYAQFQTPHPSMLFQGLEAAWNRVVLHEDARRVKEELKDGE